jgi:SRSO17 transposase
VRAAVRAQVLPVLGPIEAWIIDATFLPKKGQHAVGVARQSWGQLGQQDHCQVAVSLSVANERARLPVADRLDGPKAWAEEPARRAKAGGPEAIRFQTKPQIALEEIGQALADGRPRAIVLAEAG